MAAIERLRVYPVKGLDGLDLDAASVREGGTLEFDREFALFDEDGSVMNGKRTDAVHRLATNFDPSTRELRVESPGGESVAFDLDAERERERAADWFSGYFDVALHLRRDAKQGFVDRRSKGASVVSTATLRTVASWFDEMTIDGARRRLRANVEVAGVPPFWEDRFVGADAPDFAVEDVRFEGATPCRRCVVPERDPDTGEAIPDFRETFLEERRDTFPTWADEDAFDNYYSLMVVPRIPADCRGETLRVGDPVNVVED